LTTKLVETPQNLIPPGAHCRALQAADGAMLRMAHFTPAGAPRGTVALLQGRTEYIEKYFETIGDFLSRGFAVAILDWRGQGGSERELRDSRKGHIDDFAHYQRDLAAFLAEMARLGCPKPWFAVAHSMGAAVSLEYIHGGGAEFKRLLLSTPMMEIYGLALPQFTRLLADTLDMLGLGAAFIPGGRRTSIEEQDFATNRLTSDPVRYARNAGVLAVAPELGVGDPTIGWVNAAFRQMRRFADPEFPRNLRTPMLLLTAGRDQVVENDAIERFAQQLDIATLIAVPGARHELMMERDALRTQFFAAFDAFIPGHIDSCAA
jgi:lysophospholipase